MLITLKSNTYQPVSIIDLHQVKRTYLKQYSPFLSSVGKFIKSQFKTTAFYNFLENLVFEEITHFRAILRDIKVGFLGKFVNFRKKGEFSTRGSL